MGRFLTCLHPRRRSQCKKRFSSSCHPQVVPLHHAFYRDFRIFWFLLKILGMFPYHINKSGEVMFSWLSKEMIYSLVVYCGTSFPVVLVLRLRYNQGVQSEGNFDRVIWLYLMAFLMLPHLVIPLTHWFEMSRFQSGFKTWRQFQESYEGLLNENLSLCPCWPSKKFLLFILFITSLIVAMKYIFLSSESIWELVAHVYILFIVTIHEFLLIGLNYRLARIARELRFKVSQAVKEENTVLVGKICTLWISLSEMTKLVGGLFYRMLGYLHIMRFSISTITLYYILRAVGRKQIKMEMLYHLTFLTSNNLWIYLICECGERIVIEVGHKFALHLARLKQSVENAEMKYELDSFLCAITSFPPAMSLNGFLTVNRRLMVSINSMMVTYLIVVLQFSQDYSPPNNVEVSSLNSTNSSEDELDLF